MKQQNLVGKGMFRLSLSRWMQKPGMGDENFLPYAPLRSVPMLRGA